MHSTALFVRLDDTMCFNYETTFHSCELSIVDGSLVCPTCRQDCPTSCVIDNLFINNLNMGGGATAEGSQSNDGGDEQKICTACEEGSPVSSYCIDCADWLCDQCVQAHRRVRITKDHVIQTKDAMASNDIKPPSHSSMMHCKVVHKPSPILFKAYGVSQENSQPVSTKGIQF